MDLDREETKQAFVLSKAHLGDIIFKNVGFRYGTRVEVFEDFSTRFQHAKVTAIVGESGSGKSTLVGLIQEIFPPTKGKYSYRRSELGVC